MWLSLRCLTCHRLFFSVIVMCLSFTSPSESGDRGDISSTCTLGGEAEYVAATAMHPASIHLHKELFLVLPLDSIPPSQPFNCVLTKPRRLSFSNGDKEQDDLRAYKVVANCTSNDNGIRIRLVTEKYKECSETLQCNYTQTSDTKLGRISLVKSTDGIRNASSMKFWIEKKLLWRFPFGFHHISVCYEFPPPVSASYWPIIEKTAMIVWIIFWIIIMSILGLLSFVYSAEWCLRCCCPASCFEQGGMFTSIGPNSSNTTSVTTEQDGVSAILVSNINLSSDAVHAIGEAPLEERTVEETSV